MVGLNGVGTKAVNALSNYFKVQSIRDGKTKIAEFERGNLIKDNNLKSTMKSMGPSSVLIQIKNIPIWFYFGIVGAASRICVYSMPDCASILMAKPTFQKMD